MRDMPVFIKLLIVKKFNLLRVGKFSHPQNDILMIVNILAKTLSTPKEQDIEMPPVHENSRKRGWEDASPICLHR